MSRQVIRFPDGNGEESLEEILKRIFEKFKSGGGSGSGGSGLKPLLLGLLVLLGAISVWSSFYTVDYSEEAVVIRLGRFSAIKQPGLHFKLPFAIDQIYRVKSKRTLQEEFGFRSTETSGRRTSYDKEAYAAESLMLTGDLNVTDVEWTVQYRIKNPKDALFNVRDVRRNIRDVSMSIMRRVVGDRLASDVLTTGRVEIAAEAKELIQRVLDDQYKMGIAIQQVILQDVNPPNPVKPAFNEVNAAKQEQEQAINNAEREYNKIIPEAKGKAEQLISNANAFAIDVVNRAKGDSDRFDQVLKAYRKAPDVTRRRQYLETVEVVFGNVNSLTIVDKNIKGLLPYFGSKSNANGSAGVAADQLDADKL